MNIKLVTIHKFSNTKNNHKCQHEFCDDFPFTSCQQNLFHTSQSENCFTKQSHKVELESFSETYFTFLRTKAHKMTRVTFDSVLRRSVKNKRNIKGQDM